jgi:5'-nucleotidase (lipoprotein e(P4) family)
MALLRFLPAALLLALLSSCDTLPTRAHATPESGTGSTIAGQAAKTPNDNLNAVAWMQTSVEFRLIAGQTWRGALVQLDRAIKTPGWDALTKEDRANPAKGLPPAIIVDVDETMLDNSPYQARLIRDGQSYNEATWAEWVKEEAAKPVPGALEFARAASARGVKIFYLSNRAEDLRDATLSNLRKAGFPVKDASQFLGLGMVVDGCESEGSEKGCRRQLVGSKHRVLMQFGDQIGDMVTVVANTPAGREQAVRPYLGWVGERWFVLPNPSYGSWEPALFNNSWSQPETERRQQKLDALHY